ncbi:MAG: N-Acetyl-D-glucosamine ABC transport system, permease protein 1, partial [uncultured Thermomicrobiales bacterium]
EGPGAPPRTRPAAGAGAGADGAPGPPPGRLSWRPPHRDDRRLPLPAAELRRLPRLQPAPDRRHLRLDPDGLEPDRRAAVRRPGQLPPAAGGRPLLAERPQHPLLHRRCGAGGGLHRLLAGAPAEPQDARRCLLPDHLLPAPRHPDGGDRPGLGLDLPSPARPPELRAGADRDRRAALAAEHHLGDAGRRRHEQLAGHRLRDADLPSRVAGNPPGPTGGGHGRRRHLVPAPPPHRRPAPGADHLLHPGDLVYRRHAGLRPVLRDDPGRPRLLHHHPGHVRLPERLPVVPDGLRRHDRGRPLRQHLRHHRPPVAVRPGMGLRQRRRPV